MQPQDPTTPNPTPKEPSSPTPEPETPTPTPLPTTPKPPVEEPAPLAPADPTAPKQGKKPPMMLIAIIVAAVVVVGAGIAAYFLFFSGIALKKYDGAKFSLQVPAEFEEKAIDDGIQFNEKGDAVTASSVFAYYYTFPEELTAEQVDLLRSTFKTQLEDRVSEITGSDTNRITDAKATDVKFKGADAIQITGNAVKDGKNAGTVKLIAVINTKAVYLVGVGAHVSDPGVASAVDKIINSFTIK